VAVFLYINASWASQEKGSCTLFIPEEYDMVRKALFGLNKPLGQIRWSNIYLDQTNKLNVNFIMNGKTLSPHIDQDSIEYKWDEPSPFEDNDEHQDPELISFAGTYQNTSSNHAIAYKFERIQTPPNSILKLDEDEGNIYNWWFSYSNPFSPSSTNINDKKIINRVPMKCSAKYELTDSKPRQFYSPGLNRHEQGTLYEILRKDDATFLVNTPLVIKERFNIADIAYQCFLVDDHGMRNKYDAASAETVKPVFEWGRLNGRTYYSSRLGKTRNLGLQLSSNTILGMSFYIDYTTKEGLVNAPVNNTIYEFWLLTRETPESNFWKLQARAHKAWSDTEIEPTWLLLKERSRLECVQKPSR